MTDLHKKARIAGWVSQGFLAIAWVMVGVNVGNGEYIVAVLLAVINGPAQWFAALAQRNIGEADVFRKLEEELAKVRV